MITAICRGSLSNNAMFWQTSTEFTVNRGSSPVKIRHVVTRCYHVDGYDFMGVYPAKTDGSTISPTSLIAPIGGPDHDRAIVQFLKWLNPSYDRLLDALGKRLQHLREKRRLPDHPRESPECPFSHPAYFADHIGMSRSDYSQIERGEVNISVGALLQIADGLGVELVISFGDSHENDG